MKVNGSNCNFRLQISTLTKKVPWKQAANPLNLFLTGFSANFHFFLPPKLPNPACTNFVIDGQSSIHQAIVKISCRRIFEFPKSTSSFHEFRVSTRQPQDFENANRSQSADVLSESKAGQGDCRGENAKSDGETETSEQLWIHLHQLLSGKDGGNLTGRRTSYSRFNRMLFETCSNLT